MDELIIHNTYRDIDQVKHILDNNPEIINKLYDGRRSLLYTATLYNRTEIVKILLEHGADIELKIIAYNCCIMHYLEDFSLDICKLLIGSCKNINILDTGSFTPFMRLVEHCNEFESPRRKIIRQVCEYILETRPDLDLSIKKIENQTVYDLAIDQEAHDVKSIINSSDELIKIEAISEAISLLLVKMTNL